MRYISTRGGVDAIEFQGAVLMGLGDDGGLIIPESIPDASGSLGAWRGLSYGDLAFEVLRLYAADIDAGDLKRLIDKAYGADFGEKVASVAPAGDIHVLELWHGPTQSFKDVALQFLGKLFEYILSKRGGVLNILGATSGDTGSAAICGVRGRESIDIFMMHPHGRVSKIQQRQMTCVLDDNVHNIAVEGTFDDCQLIMKTLAGDLDFKRKYSLGAVNSVNWARVLAQMVYYFKGVFEVQAAIGATCVQVAVPTGNFGDILAGYYAKKMGAPISKLILATNENDILARFFGTGVYSLGEVHQTISPAMDIQVASNFERYLFYKVGSDAARLRALMKQFAASGALQIEMGSGGAVDEDLVSASATQDECLDTIKRYYEQHDYLLDPHTSAGVSVAERLRNTEEPVLCLATAHPAKFPDAIAKAVGKDVARHPAIDALKDLPQRCEVLPNDAEAVREFIVKTVR